MQPVPSTSTSFSMPFAFSAALMASRMARPPHEMQPAAAQNRMRSLNCCWRAAPCAASSRSSSTVMRHLVRLFLRCHRLLSALPPGSSPWDAASAFRQASIRAIAASAVSFPATCLSTTATGAQAARADAACRDQRYHVVGGRFAELAPAVVLYRLLNGSGALDIAGRARQRTNVCLPLGFS